MVKLNSAGIVAKKGSEINARRVYEFLTELDRTFVLERETAKGMGKTGIDLEEIKADFLIAIGGDGTILRTLQHSTLPIFGINAGGRGFLTEVDFGNFEQGLERLFRGEATIEVRSKISSNLPEMPDATNEIFLRRGKRPIRFRVIMDGELIKEERGDGVMVVTPTGSTSYSIGLGGPILDPRVDVFLINFVAPFDLSARPVVVPSSKVIELELIEGEGFLDCDGQRIIRVEKKIILKKSADQAKFVRLSDNFYERVREKL